LTLQKKQFLLLRFSYSLTAIIPASAALIQPLLLFLNAKLTLQKKQFLLFWLLLLSHGHYSCFCCSHTASAAPSKCQIDPTKETIPPLALLLLSHGHYSRFCCSHTASAAPSKCQIDPKKETIPPLAASPTLSRPLFPLLLLSYSLCCSCEVPIDPTKELFLLLRLLRLSQGHYSLFCCSLTASTAPPKCKPDLTKEPISPLAASPTLSRPLFPLLLLPYSLCCSF
jgi:hypothetical protein